MVYLDYSATTKTDEEVLARFNKINQDFFANPNSNYKISYESKEIIIDATNQIANYLNVNPTEIIFTSGASESNNFAIKGLAQFLNKKHIITTNLEHSSIISTMNALQQEGYVIDLVKLDTKGRVDIENLKSLINEDTFLISICMVDSELGIAQPITEIGNLLKDYPDIYFHSDITQALGKISVDLTNVDLASFSAHKIYGFKGIGGLVKKDHIKLYPLIHGGKSTTIYRSGTPQTELIDSIKTSMDLIIPKVNSNYEQVTKLNSFLKEEISKYDTILINSNEYSIPHILNISILNSNANTIQRYFASHEIYFSTKTACALNDDYSKAVYELYSDKQRAASSIRISLSYKTTKEEIKEFLKVLAGFIDENN